MNLKHSTNVLYLICQLLFFGKNKKQPFTISKLLAIPSSAKVLHGCKWCRLVFFGHLTHAMTAKRWIRECG